ncbi:MAG: PIN domain-containing protein [Opitutales bacterium]
MNAKRKVFLDSNILIYAQDMDAGARHDTARNLVEGCWQGDFDPTVSIQVLQECHVNFVKKGIAVAESQQRVGRYLQWVVVENSRALLRRAFEVQLRWGFSFWDSGIVAAALRAGVDELWTEDLQDGQVIESLVVRNPLLP